VPRSIGLSKPRRADYVTSIVTRTREEARVATDKPDQLPEIIAAPDAARMAERGDIVLVDIRRPDEWQATGYPEGAARATLQDPDFVDQVAIALGGDRSRPVVLICRTGGRTLQGMALLRDAGFGNVAHVAEGMAGSGYGPGWLARGLPVDRVD
jgi:rhodanese-related sulfurtransferase